MVNKINQWKIDYPFIIMIMIYILTQDVLKMLNQHLINKKNFFLLVE